ncbi:MAG TPA: hypothetical protein VKH81_10590 [Candidatus Angelobacter sp.]|nr:hypothetical protein [Candidatus Angelobacter sp.]
MKVPFAENLKALTGPALLATLLLGSAALCQTAPRKSAVGTKPHPAAASQNFLAGPLPSGDGLPPLFVGHSAPAIYDAALRVARKYAKSQFETQDQHYARLLGSSADPLTERLHLGDRLAFTVSASKLNVKYDAETQQLKLKFDGERDEGALAMSSSEKLLRSYPGSNAFGVTRTIREFSDVKYVVLFERPVYLPRDPFELHVEHSFPVPPDVAQKYMSSLAVAVVGPLEFPFADETKEEHTPTIDVPDEIHTQSRNLHLHVQEILLYDRITGRALSAITEDDFRKAHPLRVEVHGSPLECYVDSVKRERSIPPVGNRWERTLAGKDEVRMVFFEQAECAKTRLLVNEKPFAPQCEAFKDGYSTHYQITVRSDQIVDK